MTFWDSVFDVAVEFVVDVVVVVAIIVDEDRPIVPFEAGEAAVCSPTAIVGSSEEASGVFEVLECLELGLCSGETWAQGPC